MNIKTQIPNELESAVKGGYVTSSAQIIDYYSGLTQEAINKLILQNLTIPIFEISNTNIEVGQIENVTFTFSSSINTSVILTDSVGSDPITIELEQFGGRFSKSIVKELSSNSESSIIYTATFSATGQIIQKTVNFVYPMYYGSSSTNNIENLKSLITTLQGEGTVIKTLTKPSEFIIDFSNSSNPRYIYFAIPQNTTFKYREAILDHQFGFPLEAPILDNINGVGYKFYISSTSHDSGTYNITGV